jgi:23S rRNA pseudouridine2604 synthase
MLSSRRVLIVLLCLHEIWTRHPAYSLLTNQNSRSVRSASNAPTVRFASIQDAPTNNQDGDNIRLNKVFKATHSRRKADTLIAEGRVQVNGEFVGDMGRRVVPFQDIIQLDGRPYQGWEERHGFSSKSGQDSSRVVGEERDEEYIKYWKPVGVTSTTDRMVRGNILDSLEASRPDDQPPIRHRIFTVGRLDKDSSGIILLTSDGRVPNAVLRSKFKRPKTYHVRVDRPLRPSDLRGLRNGIRITTDRVRQGTHESITAKTLPCKVNAQPGDVELTITLTEGRNRQIRVMLDTLGYRVVDLHRGDFMGIHLGDLDRPGDWKRLTEMELGILNSAILRADQYQRMPDAEDEYYN